MLTSRPLSVSLPGIAPIVLLGAALLGAAACDPAPVDPDAASPVDAGSGMDAASPVDAGSGMDAASPVDAGDAIPCSVEGRPGTCVDVSECSGDYVPTPGFCPGPANIQCCTLDPSLVDGGPPRDAGGSCDPEAAPTPNTDLIEAAGDPGCPAGMARIEAAAPFCVDRYEAILAEVAADGSLLPFSPYLNPGSTRVRALSIASSVPQGYITGVQAEQACREAGKRLCTDSEWLRACQGAPATTYPYGGSREDGLCNDARDMHPAIEYFGTSDEWIWSMLGHRCINQLPDALALTGDHPGCVTAEGVFDMMGNLHEWTADPAGTFRGGFYVDTYRNGEGCLYRTTAHDRAHWDYSTGFRCCADAL